MMYKFGVLTLGLISVTNGAYAYTWGSNFDRASSGHYHSGRYSHYSDNSNTSSFGHTYRDIGVSASGGSYVNIPITYTHHRYHDSDNDIRITVPSKHIGPPTGNFGKAINRRP